LPDAASLRQVLNQVLAELKILFDEEFIEQIIYAIRGLTENEAYRVLHKTFMKGGGFKLQDIELLIEEKRKILKRTDLLDFSDEPIRLDDVGGLDRLKKWLVERQDGFSDTARSFGLPPPKGLLLLGVQGCGKSITAKAIASLWRIPLVRFDFSNLFRRDITPEDGLRRVIKLTESMAPIVLWIDELDKAFSNLRESQDSLTRVVGTFITWLQEKVSPVFIVATANTIEHLPPELLRKGRFDEVFFVDLPNVHEREKIFSIHIRKRGRDPVQFDLKLLAEKTEHFGGAEIEQVVVSSLFRAYHEKRDLVMADMLKSVENTIPLYETYEETIKALREWAHRRACLSSMDTSRVDLFE
jgi:SpoVK/Ycf46/Vps4 family AAA+-type ATPase